MRGKSIWSLGAVLSAYVLCCLASGPALAGNEKTPVLWPAGDITWVESPGAPGAKIAVLWGDPKTGAYGALKRIPGGSELAKHTHTHEQRVVCVAGTIALSVEGGAPKAMTAGSYLFMPAGVEHVASCMPGADCIYFEEQPGASDVKFVNPAAPKK